MIRSDILLIDDLEKAQRNRQRIANHENIKGYLEVEMWLKTHKPTTPFPSWMPINDQVYSLPIGTIGEEV